MNDEVLKYISMMKQFNSELMELNIKYSEQIEKYKDIVLDLEKHKARNEKAREYIQSTYVTDNPIKFKNTLYEILIGSDKE